MNIPQKKLNDYLANERKTYTEFALEIGVATTTISNWINKNSEPSILTCLKIANKVISDNRDYQEEMAIYYLSSLKNRKVFIIKTAFIVAYLNRYKKVLNYLIIKCKEESDQSLRFYSKIFEYFNKRLNGADSNRLFEELELISPPVKKKSKDTLILFNLFKAHLIGDLGEFGLLINYRNRIYEYLEDSPSNDLKRLFQFWIDDISNYCLLREDKLIEFRQGNKLLINNDVITEMPLVKALLILRQGESYIFSDYKRSLYYTRIAHSVFKKLGDDYRKDLAQDNMNFLKILWGNGIDRIDLNILAPSEKAFYYIRTGELEKAKAILIGIKKKGFSPLQMCYWGIVNNERSFVRESINMFIKKNESFFVKFPEMIYNNSNNKGFLFWDNEEEQE